MEQEDLSEHNDNDKKNQVNSSDQIKNDKMTEEKEN